MRVKARRRTTRALVALTACALAASSGAVLAPSAHAYLGPTELVRDTVLTSAEIASAAGWNNAANPLIGTIESIPTNDWRMNVRPTSTITNAQTVPAFSELWALPNTSLRNTRFLGEINRLTDYADGLGGVVVTSTSTVITIDVVQTSGTHATYTLRQAGSDGLAFGGCGARAATTTTRSQRVACSNAIATSQAAAWNALSPPLVFRTNSQVAGRLLSGAQAEKAAKVPSKISIRNNRTSNRSVGYDGRQTLRTYKTVAKKKRLQKVKFATPSLAGVTQFGNRTNARVAFDLQYASDRARLGATRIDTTSYSYRIDAKLRGKKTKQTVVVKLSASTFTTGACVGNPYKKPTASAERTCAQRVTNAQASRAASLFSSIG